ncbi:MAG TPA: Ig-like domain-containing protein [Pirellulaceae bacterium]|nr:Ig-like domain-containing protein [Pirellulaceae bacterium]
MQTISVTVTDANDDPVITSDGGGATASLPVAENTTAVTTVTATDVDAAGDTLTFSLPALGAADQAWFDIDGSTGALAFLTAPNFEIPTDDDTNGVYEVKVMVNDGNGGMDMQTISVTVTDANDAPVITSDGGGATAAVNVAENTTAVTSIVVTDADLPANTLTFSLPALGAADQALFTINGSSGALAFVSAPNFEIPTDDDTDGVYEVKVTVNDGNGGMDMQAISVTVTDANDAPVLDTGLTFTLPTITEDNISNQGISVATLLDPIPANPENAVTDEDTGAVEGIAVSAKTGNGTWQYSIDGGTNFVDVGTVNGTAARLLRATDWIRFVPDQEQSEIASITFRAWDQTSGAAGGTGNSDLNGGETAFSLGEEIATIDVTDINDAPILSTTGTLALLSITEDEDTNVGQDVASILASGGNPITDVDDPAGLLEGIAVNGLTGRGTWEFSIDGAPYSPMGVVSNSTALLLRAVDRVRYVPDTDNGETATIRFRAWDQSGTTAGQQGTKVPVVANGGIQPYSTATATAAITVTDLNDAPVANDDNYTTSEDATLTVSGLGVRQNDTDVDIPAQTLSVVEAQSTTVVGASLTVTSDLGAVVVVNANGTFTYDPTSSPLLQQLGVSDSTIDKFRYKLQDNGAGNLESNEATVSITVTGVNDNPTANDVHTTVGEVSGDPVMEDGPAILGRFDATDIDMNDTAQLVYDLLSTQPAEGSVAVSGTPGDNSFTFNPGNDFQDLEEGETRDVTFSYRATDPSLSNSNVAIVTVTVTGVNDRPEVQDITITTTEDGPVTADLFDGSDADGNALEFELGTPATTAVGVCDVDLTSVNLTDNFTNNMNGSFTFDPQDDFHGLAVGESCQVAIGYHADDQTGLGDALSSDATITVTVTGVNDVPVTNDDVSFTTEDAERVVPDTEGVLENDSDLDLNDTLTVVGFDVLSVLGAAVAVNPGGGYTYDPRGSATLQALKTTSPTEEDTFRVTVEDSQGVRVTETVTISVSGLNDAPVARPDFGATTEDRLLAVGARGVLTNDSDPDAGETIGLVAEPAILLSTKEASVEVFADGSYSYDPLGATPLQALRQGETTTDTFPYTVFDVNDVPTVGMVSITVTGVNDAPVANDDDANANNTPRDEDHAFTINALINDTDADFGDTLSLIRFDSRSDKGAAISVNAGGEFVYDPRDSVTLQALAANLTTPDTFTYEITDGLGVRATATVSVTVSGVNDAPVAFGNSYTTTEDHQLSVPALGVLANDRDDEGDILIVFSVNGVRLDVGSNIQLPSGARLILNTDGGFDYDPTTSPTLNALPADATVTDSFVYEAFDGFDRSSPVPVVITVSGVNDAPVARDVLFSTNEDTVLAVAAAGLLANDNDVDGDAIFANAFGGVSARGAAIVVNRDGSFQYDPRGVAGLQALSSIQNASDTFTYTISDMKGGVATATATITVQGENDAPIATDDSYRTDEDSKLIVSGQGVIENDIDVDDGDTITVVTFDVTSALGAPVTVNSDGTLTYDPTNIASVQALPFGQSLKDTFTYRVSDTKSQSNQAVVTITVDGRNDAPIARNDTYSVAEDGRLVVSSADGVLNNPDTGDSDPEGSPLTAERITPPANGQVSLSAAGGFSYTPNPDFSGVDSFTYRAKDGSISSDLATVTIVVTPVNDDPAAVSDNYTVDQESSLTVSAEDGVLANDLDVDGEQLTAEHVAGTGPNNGSLQLAGDGSFTYTPNPGFFGDDSFQYDAVDGSGVRARATVTIAVENLHNWQNPLNRFDVNADGTVSPQDALIAINYLNDVGPGPVPEGAVGPPFRDINGDDLVTANDVLVLINYLNSQGQNGEGEFSQSPLDAEGEAPILFLPGMAAGGMTNLTHPTGSGAVSHDHAPAVDALFGHEATPLASAAKRAAEFSIQSVDRQLESVLDDLATDDLATDDLAADVGKVWEEDLLGHDNL